MHVLVCKEVRRTLKTKTGKRQLKPKCDWHMTNAKARDKSMNQNRDHWSRELTPKFPLWARKHEDNTTLGGGGGMTLENSSGQKVDWCDHDFVAEWTITGVLLLPECLVGKILFQETSLSALLSTSWGKKIVCTLIPAMSLSTTCKQQSPTEYSLNSLKPQPRMDL